MHLDLRAQSLIERGVDPRDAAAEARRQFGNVLLKREEARDGWSVRAIEGLLQDVRFGLRLMRRSPAFTIVAVLSLGVGMGASAAVFSLADALLLKKLPVRAPDELVTLEWNSGPKPPTTSLSGNMISNAEGFTSTSFSLPAYHQLRSAANGVADLFAFGHLWGGVNFTADRRSDVISGQVVSGSYFNVLGIVPAAGRLIGAGDDRPDAPPVAVISHRFWQRRFGSSPDAIGKTIAINNVPATIVGVTPRGFHGTMEAGESPAITLPIAVRSALEHGNDWTSPDLWWLVLMGRFNKGVAPNASLPPLDGVFKQIVAGSEWGTDGLRAAAAALPARIAWTDRRPGESPREVITIMAAVAGVLLLVASANVASLLLVRGAARSREIAMRLSIGASRLRLIRQFITEAMMLSVLGSALGMLSAQWIARGLVAALSGGADALDLAVDARLLAFAAALGGAVLRAVWVDTGVARDTTGCSRGRAGEHRWPSGRRHAARHPTDQWSRPRAGRAVGGARQPRRSAVLFSVEPATDQPRIRFLEPADLHGVSSPERLRHAAHPLDVRGGDCQARGAAGRPIGDVLRLDVDWRRRLDHRGGSARDTGVGTGQRRVPAARATERGWRLIVGDRFFETMGIPLLRGRAFTTADAPGAAIPGVVVNRSLAQKLYKTEDAVGRRFKTGIAADAPVLGSRRRRCRCQVLLVRREAPPTLYGSYRQHRIVKRDVRESRPATIR